MNQDSHHFPMTDEERMRLLVGGVKDYAIFMLSPDGLVSTWNPGAEPFKGYEASDILGKHFSVFHTEEDNAAGVPAKALQTALVAGKLEMEGWCVRKDGKRFWANVVINPIHDASQRLIGFANIVRDISERQAIRESEQRFAVLVQGVIDYAIYMLDATGNITNWNSGAQRIKGYSGNEVIGTNFSRFYTDEDRRSGLPQRALGTAASQGRFEHEGWRVRKDGSRFWAHVIVDAIRDEAGRLVGYAKVTRDITEKKEAQEALERASAALFQSQKMEAIGQLTGGIAHDFNNLLGVLASGLDVMGTRLQDPRDIKMLAHLQEAVERGANLTQQLLAFARQQPLRVARADLNTVIRGFEAVLRRAGNSTIKFDVDLATRALPVSLDIGRFEAALLNLVVNARDAMPNGGALTIGTDALSLENGEVGHLPAGSYVKVSVSDTGIGMAPEVVAKAFEPFFTTKEPGKGTGLGLSQVYGFIAQSGGDVTIRSTVGVGTRVEIYLPQDGGDQTATAPVDSQHVETALVVEDEPALLEVATELFRFMGYEVITAGNGKDAMGILERNDKINVLFTDVMMPNGMNGIELARRTRLRNPEITIILASGYPLPALKAEHGNLDEFHFLSKPYRLAELAKRLRAAP